MRDELLADLSQRYRPEDYRLLSHNCNSFSDEFAQLLVGRGIPEHITGLADEVRRAPPHGPRDGEREKRSAPHLPAEPGLRRPCRRCLRLRLGR